MSIDATPRCCYIKLENGEWHSCLAEVRHFEIYCHDHAPQVVVRSIPAAEPEPKVEGWAAKLADDICQAADADPKLTASILSPVAGRCTHIRAIGGQGIELCDKPVQGLSAHCDEHNYNIAYVPARCLGLIETPQGWQRCAAPLGKLTDAYCSKHNVPVVKEEKKPFDWPFVIMLGMVLLAFLLGAWLGPYLLGK